MRLLMVTATAIMLVGLLLIGCSSERPTSSSADSADLSMAVERGGGEGSFTLEAKYTYFKNYPGGQAIYLLRIEPGPDFSGDAIISVSADRLIKTELTNTHLNAQTPMAELVLQPSKQLPFDSYHYITVTVSNQTHQESVLLELELVNWGILSMNRAVTAREHFIEWLEVEHPELGNLAGEQWGVYCHYPQIIIHEHYTHLSDNWELRVSCHVTWTPEDYYETLWLRPRGQWDPIMAAKYDLDEASQSWIIYETPLEDWKYYFGY